MFNLIIGATLGGAAMYYLDPDRGRRRRALARDKAVSASHSVQNFVDAGTRDLKSRGKAMSGRVRSLVSRRHANDQVLAERVRSAMGRHVLHPGAIDVDADHGQITLSGSVLAHERDGLLEAVRQVSGVSEAIDHLSVYETAEGISDRQGGRESHIVRFTEPQTWAPGTQLLAGTAVALFLLKKSSKLRGLLYLAAAGAALAKLTPEEQRRHAIGPSGADDDGLSSNVERKPTAEAAA